MIPTRAVRPSTRCNSVAKASSEAMAALSRRLRVFCGTLPLRASSIDGHLTKGGGTNGVDDRVGHRINCRCRRSFRLDFLFARQTEQNAGYRERQAQYVEGRAHQKPEVHPEAAGLDVVAVVPQLPANTFQVGVRRELKLGKARQPR